MVSAIQLIAGMLGSTSTNGQGAARTGVTPEGFQSFASFLQANGATLTLNGNETSPLASVINQARAQGTLTNSELVSALQQHFGGIPIEAGTPIDASGLMQFDAQGSVANFLSRFRQNGDLTEGGVFRGLANFSFAPEGSTFTPTAEQSEAINVLAQKLVAQGVPTERAEAISARLAEAFSRSVSDENGAARANFATSLGNLIDRINSGDLILPAEAQDVILNGGSLAELRMSLLAANGVAADGFAYSEPDIIIPDGAETPESGVEELTLATAPEAVAADETTLEGSTNTVLTEETGDETITVEATAETGTTTDASASDTINVTGEAAETVVAEATATPDAEAALSSDAVQPDATVDANTVGTETPVAAPAEMTSVPQFATVGEVMHALRHGDITMGEARTSLQAIGRPLLASMLGGTQAPQTPLDRFTGDMAAARNAQPIAATTGEAAVQSKLGGAGVVGEVPQAERHAALQAASAQAAAQGPKVAQAAQTTATQSPEALAELAKEQGASKQAEATVRDGIHRDAPARDANVRPEAASGHLAASAAGQAAKSTNVKAGETVATNTTTNAKPDTPQNLDAVDANRPPARTPDQPVEQRVADHRPAVHTPTNPAPQATPAATDSIDHQTAANQRAIELHRADTAQARQTMRFDAHTRAAAVQDLSVSITRFAGQGINRFQVRLDPPEMGRVDVRLEVGHDGRVTAHVAADRPETLDALRQDARVLERALNDAGLKTDQNSLGFSLRDGGNGAGQGMGQGQNGMPEWASTGPEEQELNVTEDMEAAMMPEELAGGLRILRHGGVDVRA